MVGKSLASSGFRLIFSSGTRPTWLADVMIIGHVTTGLTILRFIMWSIGIIPLSRMVSEI